MKSKALLLGIVLLTLVSLLSCELFLEKPEKPTINGLFVSLDYVYHQKIHDSTSYYGPLPGTIPDIKEVIVAFHELTGEDYFSIDKTITMMLEEDGVVVKPDSMVPTRTNIQQQLLTYHPGGLNANGDDDILLLYYTGHGGEFNEPMVVAESKDSTYVDFITVEDLNDWTRDIKGKVVLILDSCFSGQIIETYPRSKAQREISTYEPHIYHLTASSASQESYEFTFPDIGHRHGYFSRYFLEAVGWNHISVTSSEADIDGRTISVPGDLGSMEDIPTMSQGSITITGIYQFIIEKFTFAQDWISSQTPQTGRGPLDLVLFSEHW